MAHTKTIIDGEQWPSVTEITSILVKKSLAKWREYVGTKEADRISKEAAERGTLLHSLVEQFLKGETVVLPTEEETIRPRFKAWFDWWKESKYICLGQEIKVISKKYKYGGTFDAILGQGDQMSPVNRTLVDWKFSNTEDWFRWLQLAGYAQAHYEETGTKIKRGMIVRIDKKAKVHVKEEKNLWKFVPLFIAARKLFAFVNREGIFAIKK